MDTLKLTMLTLLIPLGWAISADAYPQPVELSNPSPASTCHMAQRSKSPTASVDEDVAAVKEALRALEAEESTSDNRDSHTLSSETCRLDLDPIEIN